MKRLTLSLALSTAATLVLAGCSSSQAPVPEAPERLAARTVERGKYLAGIMGCGDCHTPMKMGPNGPEPDMARYLAGHPEGMTMPAAPVLSAGPWVMVGAATNTAFAGPWGMSYARNITSDEATGLGAWTEEMFVKALKTGKSYGGARPILPPMPWQAYSSATEDDLKALFAYLKTVPAISNRSPDSIVAQP